MAGIWLHLAALWAVAVAQPLFELLGANPEFFIAHRAGPVEILAVALVLGLALPSILAAFVGLVGLAGPRARDMAMAGVIGALGFVLASQLAVRAGVATWMHAVAASAAAGAGLAFAYQRLAAVRTFFTVLSIAVLVIPVLFLSRPGIRSLIGAGAARVAASGERPEAADGMALTTPVVLVIFDSLPLVSLLDGDRNIDPLLYPNFAALARDGVWYRNATTVNDFTRWSVPSIVSGKYPRYAALPAAVDHPDTLFTLLANSHRFEVRESVTDLCPRELCRSETGSAADRLMAIARDLRVVFLHAILTPDLTAGLPDPTRTWAGFGDDAGEPDEVIDHPEMDGDGGAPEDETADARQEAREQWGEGLRETRVGPVREFIDGIEADDPQPSLYFLHTLVSHHPYDMLPGGKRNTTSAIMPGKIGGRWDSRQEWAVAQQYQRHLLQVGFVDDLVGELVARLKSAGIYDRAMVIVTADHGIAHVPGAPQRNFVGENGADIVRVPIIIKYPDRIPISRRVSDTNAEIVDIVPTIADALTVKLPFAVDGTSLLDPGRQERPTKAVFSGATGRRRDIDAGGPPLAPALRRKLDLFGDGVHNVHRAPRMPEYDELIGRPVTELPVENDGGPVEIARAWLYEIVDPSSAGIPFDISGRFQKPMPGTVLAVAVNGVVEAVTRTWEANPRGWVATPRLDVWQSGRNRIEVFVAEREATEFRLHRTSVGQVRPGDLNAISAEAAADWGVRQWGFYPVEHISGGRIFRWTKDVAELSNLFAHDPPREVEIDVAMVPRGQPKVLKIEANDCVLYEGEVRHGWTSRFSLEPCDVLGKGLVLRFTTDAPRGREDKRRLGVGVSRVILR